MKHSLNLKLTLLLLLLLPLAAMAQTYIITGSGTSFSATKGGAAVAGATDVAIANVITAIRTDANGADCIVQFGSGSTDTLNIGAANTTFDNTDGTWGYITLLGNITSYVAAVNVDGPSMESKANITSTSTSQGLSNYGSGTLTISGGSISSVRGEEGAEVYNSNTGTIIISGGKISTLNNIAVYNASTGKIIVSGDAYITSARTSSTHGTIHSGSSGTVEIIGGTIVNTTESGNAVYFASANQVLLGGNPNIIGKIKKGGTGNLSVITDPDIGIIFAPVDKVYTLDFASITTNGIAVVNGKDFLENFSAVANANFEFIVSGDNLVLRLKGFAYTKSAENVYTITSSFDATTTITNVIAAIKTDAGGTDCSIQFEDGENTLNIGTPSITFSNTGGTWGLITLLGKLTNSGSAAAIIVNGPSVDSKASIIKNGYQYGIRNDGTGTLTISGGTISATDYTVYNGSTGTIVISGGTISATESPSFAPACAIFNGYTGKIIVSGDAYITSVGVNRGSPNGTIYIASGTAEITGGTIANTASGNAIYNNSTGAVTISGGIISATMGMMAVYNVSTGSIILGGSPNITGEIRKGGEGNLSVITDPNIGTVFAPATDYTLDFDTYTADDIAVENGKDFLGTFKVKNNEWGLVANGNDLVIATAQNVCETNGNQWVGETCKTALQIAQEECEADDSQVWENNACREKTAREVCLETTGNQWVGETCKTALQIAQEECEADDSKVWENGECNDITPIRTPQIASSQISVKAVNGAIMLENLPKNARVEIYNLEGKRLRSNNPENLKILKITLLSHKKIIH